MPVLTLAPRAAHHLGQSCQSAFNSSKGDMTHEELKQTADGYKLFLFLLKKATSQDRQRERDLERVFEATFFCQVACKLNAKALQTLSTQLSGLSISGVSKSSQVNPAGVSLTLAQAEDLSAVPTLSSQPEPVVLENSRTLFDKGSKTSGSLSSFALNSTMYHQCVKVLRSHGISGEISQAALLKLTREDFEFLQNLPDTVNMLRLLTMCHQIPILMQLEVGKMFSEDHKVVFQVLLDKRAFIQKARGEFVKNLVRVSKVQHLSLAFCGLTLIPACIEYYCGLDSLDLKGNKLTVLPEDLNFLPKLYLLDVKYNPLGEFPSSFSQMTKLKFVACDRPVAEQNKKKPQCSGITLVTG